MSDTISATGTEPRSRTGYRAVAAGFVGNMTSVGLTLYLFGIVLDDMRETFGASVTTMSFAASLWHVVNAGVSL